MSMKHGQHYWRELKTTSIKKVKLFSQHHEEKIYTTMSQLILKLLTRLLSKII